MIALPASYANEAAPEATVSAMSRLFCHDAFSSLSAAAAPPPADVPHGYALTPPADGKRSLAPFSTAYSHKRLRQAPMDGEVTDERISDESSLIAFLYKLMMALQAFLITLRLIERHFMGFIDTSRRLVDGSFSCWD